MPQGSESDSATPAVAKPKRKRKSKPSAEPRRLPPFNVVLLDDDEHTYEYVIEMLRALFGYPAEKGHALAYEVDHTGRAIVLTTTKEHAELKRDQIHAYGRDQRISSCRGSMSATIEPAPQ
jgi:ATP-dependent Clp protease adaptor protein ClpS